MDDPPPPYSNIVESKHAAGYGYPPPPPPSYYSVSGPAEYGATAYPSAASTAGWHGVGDRRPPPAAAAASSYYPAAVHGPPRPQIVVAPVGGRSWLVGGVDGLRQRYSATTYNTHILLSCLVICCCGPGCMCGVLALCVAGRLLTRRLQRR